MFRNTDAGAGGGDAGNGSQQGYQMRGRGGRHDAQEERYVEGDLFGNAKRAIFRSSDPPPGKLTQAVYYDGATGTNAFRDSVGGGGYGHNLTAQASPFTRVPAHPSSNFMSAGPTAYSSRSHGQATPATDVGRGYSSSLGTGNEVALVPVDSNGGNRGRSVMDDDDDDDFMPTRSLADMSAARESGDVGGEGLRHRRSGGEVRMGGLGVGQGFGRETEPDLQRATWIVVWGVPPGKINDTLACFLRFGHIEEQRGAPGSNWLYFKYSTRLQAEKALAAGHGSRLTETVMLGVQRVPDDETWRSLREGRIPQLNTLSPVLGRKMPKRTPAGTPSTRPPSGEALEIDDTDLLDGPPRRPTGEKSVCRRVMAFFGFY